MAFHRTLDRLRRMHRLIKFRRTGPPAAFAAKLGVSPSQLYKLLAEMKELGAPVRYCRIRRTYTYYQRVELQLGFYAPGAGEASGAALKHLASRRTAS